MTARAQSVNRRLAAARAIAARCAPPHPAAWLELSAAEHDARISALKLASRRVDELTTSRVL